MMREKNPATLKNKVQLLKTENQKLKEEAVFEKTNDHRFVEISDNFTKASNIRTQYESRE